MSRNDRPPHRTFGRLSLESLESRLNPADFWWDPMYLEPDGVTYSSAVAGNWTMGPSAPWDRWEVAPGPNDDLKFRGDVTQRNCTLVAPSVTPSPGQPQFRALDLLFSPQLGGLPGFPAPPREGYWGTVTMAGSLSVGELNVECGQIKQADPATVNNLFFPDAGTLTVMLSLDWTGGTLNSNTVHGKIKLAPYVTGEIAPSYTNPGINQTVNLGSTIELLANGTAGSTLDVLSGTYNITNGAGFIVNNQCSLQMMPDPQDAPRGGGGGGGNPPPLIADVQLSEAGTKKDGGSVTVEEGGVATFKPRACPADSTAPARYKADGGYLVNRGGKVVIEDRTEVQLGGEYQVQGGFKWSAVTGTAWTNSLWQIQAACSILTANGTAIGAGQLQILPAIVASTGNHSMTEKEATIGLLPGSTADYALVVKGTAVVSMPQGAGAPYLTLAVGGNFGWSGGEIKLALSAGDTQCDKITATGNIEISGTPKLSLRWYEASMLNTAVDTIWELMKSTDGKITGAVNANWYDNPDTKVVMDVSISGDEKTLRAIKQPNKP